MAQSCLRYDAQAQKPVVINFAIALSLYGAKECRVLKLLMQSGEKC